MVIGVICAVIGIGGGIQNAWHFITFLLVDGLQKIVQQVMNSTGGTQSQVQAQMDISKQMMDKWGHVLIGAVIVKFAAAVVLTIGGLMLCQQRSVSVKVLRLWGIASLAIAAFTAVTTALMQADQMRLMQATPGGAPFLFNTTMIVLIACMTFVISGILPLFILIWMKLRSTRSEVATWKP